MSKKLTVLRAFGVVGTLAGLLAVAPAATAQTKVFPFPGDPSWSPFTAMGGTAVITGANPRYGNGSLALGATGDLFDWGFYQTWSGLSPWGRLGDITHLSFEWYRTTLPYTQPEEPYFGSWPDAPWLAQTPALRLLLGTETDNGLLFSELVWERYYTDGSPVALDTWVMEDLFAQNFWHDIGGLMYSVSDCELVTPGTVTPPPVWELLLGTPTGWAGGSFANASAATACQGFNIGDAWVYGLSVGVGSNWPDQWSGNVDYVRLAFNDEDAVWANFELPETTVPEPATVVLLGTGLLGLALARRLKRRS